MLSSSHFRIGLTKDFLNPSGDLGWGDIGLGRIDEEPGVSWEFLPSSDDPLPEELGAEYDALIVNLSRVTRETVKSATRLALVARFGVGLDSVDLASCTHAGVAVTNTPAGIRRPLASSVVCFILALAHRLIEKDRLVRTGHWADRLDFIGSGLTNRTVGLVGMGNVGREVVRLLAPWAPRIVFYDPYVTNDELVGQNVVRSEDLAHLMRVSDFVAVLCPLTSETAGLIGSVEIAQMRRGSFLVAVSRGGIVDEAALANALETDVIAGAALDVFATEPLSPTSRILDAPRTLLAPHSICWTDEMAIACGRSAIDGALAVARGEAPAELVNRGVLDSEAFTMKLRKLAERRSN